MSVSFETMGRELIIAIRGKMTQTAMADRCEFRPGMVSKLETGSQKIYWSVFGKICDAAGKDLSQVFDRQLSTSININSARRVFKSLAHGYSAKEVCAWLECSPATYSRWRSKAKDVPLAPILGLLEKQGALVGVLAQLADVAKIPSYKKILEQQNRARTLFKKFPEAALILCCCDLKPYLKARRYRPGFFSKLLPISAQREDRLVQALLQAGLAKMYRQKLVPTTYFTNVAWAGESTYLETKAIKKFWLHKALRGYHEDSYAKQKCSGGYEVFSASLEVLEQIRQEIGGLHRKIHTILEASGGSATDDVFVFQHHLMRASK